jgi:hydrogenase/urease accessory protein HupE
MAITLLLWGGFAAFCGFMYFASAKSAVDETEAGLGFLIATVAISCAGCWLATGLMMVISAVWKIVSGKKTPVEKGLASGFTNW